jgi:hypothetical protein
LFPAYEVKTFSIKEKRQKTEPANLRDSVKQYEKTGHHHRVTKMYRNTRSYLLVIAGITVTAAANDRERISSDKI